MGNILNQKAKNGIRKFQIITGVLAISTTGERNRDGRKSSHSQPGHRTKRRTRFRTMMVAMATTTPMEAIPLVVLSVLRGCKD